MLKISDSSSAHVNIFVSYLFVSKREYRYFENRLYPYAYII